MLAILGAAIPSIAVAARTSPGALMRVINGGGDSNYNYDFTPPCCSIKRDPAHIYFGISTGTNVDWADSLLFYNSASVSRVKHYINYPNAYTGGPMYGYVNDGGAPAWDGDSGNKDSADACTPEVETPDLPAGPDPPDVPPVPVDPGAGGISTRHVRLYADGDDHMYNTTFGYYVYGTTHVDYNENCADEWFGNSEITEADIAQRLGRQGFVVSPNYAHLGNAEPHRCDGTHCWNQNGMATYVNIHP